MGCFSKENLALYRPYGKPMRRLRQGAGGGQDGESFSPGYQSPFSAECSSGSRALERIAQAYEGVFALRPF